MSLVQYLRVRISELGSIVIKAIKKSKVFWHFCIEINICELKVLAKHSTLYCPVYQNLLVPVRNPKVMMIYKPLWMFLVVS